MSQWRRVRRDHPCVLCGRGDWCIFTGEPSNPEAVICPRTPGGKDLGESGYLHRLREDKSVSRTPAAPVHKAQPSSILSPDQWDILVNTWALSPNDLRLAELADHLGVPPETLLATDVGWAAARDLHALGTSCSGDGCWAWPMRDGWGHIVGVRLRTGGGFKYSVAGGLNGLFIPRPFSPGSTLFCCEGPTTLAALLALGTWAVGRASCNTGVQAMIVLAGQLRCTDLVIVADRDRIDARTGVAPGLHYALRLADQVNNAWRRVRVIQPPEGCKDLRDWYRAGGTAEQLTELVNCAPSHQVGRCRLMSSQDSSRIASSAIASTVTGSFIAV